MPKAPTVGLFNVLSFFRHCYGHDPAHYPMKGIRFVLSHPKLLMKVARVACTGIVTALAVFILLFMYALEPQAEAFGGKQWWSWVIAVLFVLLEASLVAALLLVFIRSKAQTDVFVTTMRLKGKWREGEMIAPMPVRHFDIFKKAFYVRVITYPLNIIPFVGAGLYSLVNATFVGWDYMDMYFESIGMNMKTQRIEVFGEDKSDFSALFSSSTYDDNNPYARFGFMCSLFELMPLVGPVIFPLFNASAAALFACDIEKRGGPVSVSPEKRKGRSIPGGDEESVGEYQHPEVPNTEDQKPDVS